MGLIKPAALRVLQLKKTHFRTEPLAAEKSFAYYNAAREERAALGQMAGRYPRRAGGAGPARRAARRDPLTARWDAAPRGRSSAGGSAC